MASIGKSPQEESLISLCNRMLGESSFRVLDLDFREGSRSLVRIFLENTASVRDEGQIEGGVSLDDCAEVSRLLEPTLEELEALSGAFDLEVSSPGLDRRLREKTHFEKAIGNLVKFKLWERIEGLGSGPTGSLVGVDENGLEVEFDGGRQHQIPWKQIKQANQVWSPPGAEPSGKRRYH